ncbi:MAG: tetratricopeptide repeat protein [Thaumarchaeota archaeon]|nr:tetratricopeptide repeat protein [Nitrososphaerota archaeon]
MKNSEQAEGARSLAAIMFTDMVGFTALAQKNESQAMRMLKLQRMLVRPLLAKHKGREVKTIGDAFLVEFSSSLEAVRCAGEIQAVLRDANRARQEEKIILRIGIHLGDVIHAGSDVYGDAVNVASRIEPLAPPGGICVSAQVHDSVVNKVDFRFDSLGTPELKNVSTPMQVYQISGFGEKVSVSSPAKPLTPQNDRMAVLPFVNIAQGTEEYFADGMTEEIISSISRTPGLRVIARTSVMKYKGTNKSVSEIGRQLNVGSVLEGSVRKAGDRVRITVQLVDTSNEEPKWSQEYDRELRDIFAIQSDISQKVVDALRVQVMRRGSRDAGKGETKNPEAYVQYLRGRQNWNRRTKADLEEAIRRFEAALEMDPTYAKAYSGIADCHAMLASYATEYVPPKIAYPQARDSVTKALALDPDLVEAHTSLGVVRFQYDWDWDGAEEEFRKSLDLNPNYAPAHQFYSDHLKATGRLDEALAEIRRAQELDPLSLPINSAVGHVLYLSRQYDDAIEQYKKTLELDPNFMQTHIWFGRPFLEKGMYEEAIQELRIGVRLSGESNVALGMLGHGLAAAERGNEAREILEKLKERSRTQYVSSYWIAAVYNGFKDGSQTVSWLRKAFDERSSWLVWSNVEPRFDWLRDDPEFASLMKAMRFP